jgi:phosphatidylinositol 4-kinase
MIDKEGHVIHIDFGFVFGLAPGKAFSMEKAPWKLNRELAEVMGGKHSEYCQEYRRRCIQALTVARKHAHEVILLMGIMQFNSNYPAFK